MDIPHRGLSRVRPATCAIERDRSGVSLYVQVADSRASLDKSVQLGFTIAAEPFDAQRPDHRRYHRSRGTRSRWCRPCRGDHRDDDVRLAAATTRTCSTVDRCPDRTGTSSPADPPILARRGDDWVVVTFSGLQQHAADLLRAGQPRTPPRWSSTGISKSAACTSPATTRSTEWQRLAEGRGNGGGDRRHHHLHRLINNAWTDSLHARRVPVPAGHRGGRSEVRPVVTTGAGSVVWCRRRHQGAGGPRRAGQLRPWSGEDIAMPGYGVRPEFDADFVTSSGFLAHHRRHFTGPAAGGPGPGLGTATSSPSPGSS